MLKFKNLLLLCFFLAILCGLWVRFYRFGSIPVGLYWDEVAIAADAKAVALTGFDLHQQSWWQPIYLSYGDYKLPAYIWFSSVVALFTSNPVTIVRLPALFVGLGTIIMAGLLSVRLFAQKKENKFSTFVFGAFIMAVSCWATHFSRVGFEAYLGQLLISIAVWLSLSSKKVNWILAQLVAGAAVYSYFSVRFVWPFLFLALVIYQACQQSLLLSGQKSQSKQKISLLKTKDSLIKICTLIIFLIVLLPLIKSGYYQSMLIFRYSAESVLNSTDWPALSRELQSIEGGGLLGRVIYHRYWLLFRQLLANFSKHLSLDFLFLSGDANLRHGTGLTGLFLLPTLLPLMSGIYHLIKEKWLTFILLLCWWLISIVPAAVPMEVPHALRSLNALMPIVLIMSFGLLRLFEFSQKPTSGVWNVSRKTSLLFIWIILVLFGYGRFAFHYFSVYPSLSQASWQGGYAELAQVACESYKESHPLILSANDQRFFLWILANCEISANDYQEAHFQQAHLKTIGSLMFVPLNEVDPFSTSSQTWWLRPTIDPLKENLTLSETTSLMVGDEQYSLYNLTEKLP